MPLFLAESFLNNEHVQPCTLWLEMQVVCKHLHKPECVIIMSASSNARIIGCTVLKQESAWLGRYLPQKRFVVLEKLKLAFCFGESSWISLSQNLPGLPESLAHCWQCHFTLQIGCPPRIPGGETLLYEVHLLSAVDRAAADSFEDLEEGKQTLTTFQERLEAAQAHHRQVCFHPYGLESSYPIALSLKNFCYSCLTVSSVFVYVIRCCTHPSIATGPELHVCGSVFISVYVQFFFIWCSYLASTAYCTLSTYSKFQHSFGESCTSSHCLDIFPFLFVS